MKNSSLILPGVFVGLAFLFGDPVFGQTNACPGRALTYTLSNTTNGILPSGTTLGLGITVNSGSSTYLTTSPNDSTSLISAATGGTPAAIVIDSNFKTNIGESGVVFISFYTNCGENPQAAKDSTQTITPASVSADLPLLVYPTVTTGLVTITGQAADLSNAAILVTDESGRTVYRTYNGGTTTTTVSLNLGNLGNGLYFIRVNTAAKIKVQKIIIQK